MTWWALGFAATGAVVVLVAVLLIGILWQARRIRRLALAAADIVGEVDTNTRSVWRLSKINKTAGVLLDGTAAIEGNARAIRKAVAHDAPDADAA